ncbi:MAG: hypothetical protein Q8P51_06295 [Ignavibacteria bacterium]|nr:hypothetical protein [Ignavibacteria bacterium]
MNHGSGSISEGHLGKSVPDEFAVVVKDHLREILNDLFEQYDRAKADQTIQDRNMLIRQICMLAKLYHESDHISKSRTHKHDEDEDLNLFTEELRSVFRACIEKYIGGLKMGLKQIPILADDDSHTVVLERIAEHFDETFNPFFSLIGGGSCEQ